MVLFPIFRAAALPAVVSASVLDPRGLQRASRPISLLVALGVLASMTTTLAAAPSPGVETATAPIRFLDLTGDGLTDMLIDHGDSLSVSINLAGGVFADLPTRLPSAALADVLATDLDGDGLLDLYLVSQAENVALLGDGSGAFLEATLSLGLADGGRGVSAERMVFDIHGEDALVLHNTDGDVLFWPNGNGFVRDARTPARSLLMHRPGADLRALELLVAQAAELLALDPGEELVLGLDDAGQPRVSLGSDRGAFAGASGGLNMAGPAIAQGAPMGNRSGGLAQGTVGTAGTTGGAGIVGGHGAPPPAIAALTTDEQAILDTMSIVMLDDGAGNLVNKTVRFTGVNLQVVNGLGATNGNSNNPVTINPANTTVNGVGNLIVGYNELGNTLGDARTGSHNVVLGQTNSHTTFGGLLGGRNNTISGVFASISGGEKNNAKARLGSISGGKSNTVKGAFTSVSGGTFNLAIGQNASVSGGLSNKASGVSSWAGGGKSNQASGINSSVSGGRLNTASSDYSSVSGGSQNTASGYSSSVSGGLGNTAMGKWSSVSGGRANAASGYFASVSGGQQNIASGGSSTKAGGSVTGGYNNTAGGNRSSVTGGRNNTAGGLLSSVSGGRSNTASGYSSSVSGGNNRTAANPGDWVAGSLFEDN